MDSSKAAAVVWPLGPGAKVRSQLGPKGAIHGKGASPSGLLGNADHLTVIVGLGKYQRKKIRKRFHGEKFPQKPGKVSVFERLKSG